MRWIKIEDVPAEMAGKQVVVKNSDAADEPYWIGHVGTDRKVTMLGGDEIPEEFYEFISVLEDV